MDPTIRSTPLLLLLLVGCAEFLPEGGPPADAGDPTPSTCAFSATLEVGRTRGVFPMPMSAAVVPDCPGGDVEVTWDLGDGTVRRGLAVDHRYLGSGEFLLTATVTDGGAPVVLTETLEIARPPCPLTGESSILGSTASDELDEASGLGHSRADGGVLWTHNDSGDRPRLFAMSVEGGHLGTFLLEGAPDGFDKYLARFHCQSTGRPRHA